jgi:hypothetical protein
VEKALRRQKRVSGHPSLCVCSRPYFDVAAPQQLATTTTSSSNNNSSSSSSSTTVESGPRFCSQCGAPLVANAKFCSQCGSPVLLPPAVTFAPFPVPPPPINSAAQSFLLPGRTRGPCSRADWLIAAHCFAAAFITSPSHGDWTAGADDVYDSESIVDVSSLLPPFLNSLADPSRASPTVTVPPPSPLRSVSLNFHERRSRTPQGRSHSFK